MNSSTRALQSARRRVEESLTLVVGRPRRKRDTRDGQDEPLADYAFLKVRLQQGVAERFRLLCREALELIETSEKGSYEPDSELASGEVFVIDDEESLRELALFRGAASGAATATPIAPKDLDARLQFYAVVAGDRDRIVFVRKTNPQLRYKSGGFLVSGRDRLSEIDGPLFSFSPDFDFVVAHGWGAILSQHRFEMLFRETGIVARNIAEWVTGITDHLPMPEASVEALQAAARRDSRLWRKLRTIHRRGHLKTVTINEVRAYAQAVNVSVESVIRGEQLVFDPAERFTIMHLLNEDLFRGPITEEVFEAQRKASADGS